MLDLLEKGENVSGGKCDSVRKRQLLELKSFMDSVVPTREDKYLLGGDLNIEGGSPEYAEMTRLFGRQSLNAPDFHPTYNTDSFLTPPGWRDVEYSVCLDHVLSNLDVEQFSVLQDDISDHRGLSVLVIPPRPSVSLAGAAAGAAHSPNSMAGAAGVGGASLPMSPCADSITQRAEAFSLALVTAEEVEEAKLAAEKEVVPTILAHLACPVGAARVGPARVQIEIE